MFTLPEHPSSPTFLEEVRVAQYLAFCFVFCILSLYPFVSFPLDIALPVRLRFISSDYPCGISKLLLQFAVYNFRHTALLCMTDVVSIVIQPNRSLL